MNLDKEKVRYEDKNFIVVDTLDKKGHNERIMIVRKEHGKTITPFTEREANVILEKIGKTVFDSDFCLLNDDFSSTVNHWHKVASDFKGDDLELIQKTKHIFIPYSN